MLILTTTYLQEEPPLEMQTVSTNFKGLEYKASKIPVILNSVHMLNSPLKVFEIQSMTGLFMSDVLSFFHS